MNKVYALYDFTAELDLELSIDAGEELELVDAKDSWVRIFCLLFLLGFPIHLFCFHSKG